MREERHWGKPDVTLGLFPCRKRNYADDMPSDAPLLFVPIGTNAARPFGIEARDRACGLAANAGFHCADAPQEGRAVLLASMRYAWDPAWLKAMHNRAGTVLTFAGEPVMIHVPANGEPAPAATAIENGTIPAGYEQLDADAAELRKRGRPFVMLLDPNDPEPAERAAYDASYKSVTDILTLYVWRKPAFYLTRWAARAGLTPNMITAVGAILCVLAFFAFWHAHYWLGMLSGLIFMVLDTVDGELARCTGSSSKSGSLLDNGIDLVHPPLWYWAWAHGLAAYGRPIEPFAATMILLAIIIGYVTQRMIEGIFIKRFDGMHIHVWQRIDSRFRLITARRNPNMVILFFALLIARPDLGLQLVAWWTIISLIFHAVRLAQATERAARGRPIKSWLEA